MAPVPAPVQYVRVVPSGRVPRCKCAGGDHYYPACQSVAAKAVRVRSDKGKPRKDRIRAEMRRDWRKNYREEA